MKIAILLSASLHPVSQRPALSRIEAQAVAMALDLGGDIVGFHAGPDCVAAASALGHGLPRLIHLRTQPTADPVPPLVAEFQRFQPDLVLTGSRSVGADETGLVPYRFADALGWPILADAVSVERMSDGFKVASALPKGERLICEETGPLVLTLHPAAPPPRAYAYAQERRGLIETRSIEAELDTSPRPLERPMRQRAKVKASATGGSAADRLKAATEMAASTGGELLVDPEPEMAARAILRHLRDIGALPAVKDSRAT
ncbi:hypothetical protein NS226_03425 [Aureimonas ureilytica]|uniref:Electron transfer flavoprotein alpha/beta-subunit N-terminal domain-containing protein n=1 Tax=Aureimonas ureilytica TaxID=401562 RepID=A0A175RCQ5_9HYPH|nr:hypothetical protein [Aureimonas ureilytica]KTQ97715.1 hypothetical protein NS226_03425 [Aureimonas ureilytica]